MVKRISILVLSFILLQCASEKSFFRKVSEENTADAYYQFLKKYPNGEFAHKAKIKKEQLEYESAKNSNTLYGYKAFLNNYPDSKFRKNIEEEIAFLKLQETDDKNKYTEFMGLYPESKHISFINEKLAFLHALEDGTKDSYTKFLENYPKSQFAPRIEVRLLMFKDAYIVNDDNWRLAHKEYKKMKYSSYYFYFQSTMLDEDAATNKLFLSGDDQDTLSNLVTTRPINHRNYEYLNVFSCMIKEAEIYAKTIHPFKAYSLKGKFFLTFLFTFVYSSLDEEGITATIYCRSDEYDSKDLDVLKYKNEVIDMLADNINEKTKDPIIGFLTGIKEKEKNKKLLSRIDQLLSN